MPLLWISEWVMSLWLNLHAKRGEKSLVTQSVCEFFVVVAQSNASLGSFSLLALSHFFSSAFKLVVYTIKKCTRYDHGIVMENRFINEIYWPFTKLIINKNGNAIIFQVINSLYDDFISIRFILIFLPPSLALSPSHAPCMCECFSVSISFLLLSYTMRSLYYAVSHSSMCVHYFFFDNSLFFIFIL